MVRPRLIFTDLVETRVPNATMIQQFAHQIHNKQQFILRKPGGPGPDSRDITALSGGSNWFVRASGGSTATSGSRSRWSSTTPGRPGGCHPTHRSAGSTCAPARPTLLGWEMDFVLDEEFARGTWRAPAGHRGDQVPASFAGQELAANLVAEQVAWFDLFGTEPVIVPLPASGACLLILVRACAGRLVGWATGTMSCVYCFARQASQAPSSRSTSQARSAPRRIPPRC